jgi:hypothetical protein
VHPPVAGQEATGGRLLLRFDGHVTNVAGAGPLEIRSSDPDPATDVMGSVSRWRDVAGPGIGGAPQGRGGVRSLAGIPDHENAARIREGGAQPQPRWRRRARPPRRRWRPR